MPLPWLADAGESDRLAALLKSDTRGDMAEDAGENNDEVAGAKREAREVLVAEIGVIGELGDSVLSENWPAGVFEMDIEVVSEGEEELG